MEYGITDIVQLFGGISLFLFAMNTMSEGVQKVAGSSLRSFLNIVTTNKYLGVFSGFIITGIIQSSSATTVMVISFVNAGLISLTQSVGVIMGANIGTTLTSWLINGLGFSEIGLSTFALPAIAIGVPIYYSGSAKGKSWGEFLIGFGLLFLGLSLMKDAVPTVEQLDTNFISYFKHYTSSWFTLPLFILLGTLMAVILQSSSSAMGITIVLAAQGWLPMNAAVGLILGENVGTTITAYLASVVANTGARRAARIHFLFNLIGVIWITAIIPWFIEFVDYLNMNFLGCTSSVFADDSIARGKAMTSAIAVFHTTFNFANVLLLIHFVPQIVKLSKRMVPSKKGGKKGGKIAMNKFLDMPEMTVLQASKQLEELASISSKIVKKYRQLRTKNIQMDMALISKIERSKLRAHDLHAEITSFLIEVSQGNQSETAAKSVVRLLNISNVLIRVVHKAYQLCDIEKVCFEESIEFDETIQMDLADLAIEIERAHEIMEDNLRKWDVEVIQDEAKLQEDRIDKLRDKIKERQYASEIGPELNLNQQLFFRDIYQALEKAGDYIYEINQYL